MVRHWPLLAFTISYWEAPLKEPVFANFHFWLLPASHHHEMTWALGACEAPETSSIRPKVFSGDRSTFWYTYPSADAGVTPAGVAATAPAAAAARAMPVIIRPRRRRLPDSGAAPAAGSVSVRWAVVGGASIIWVSVGLVLLSMFSFWVRGISAVTDLVQSQRKPGRCPLTTPPHRPYIDLCHGRGDLNADAPQAKVG